MSNDESFPRPTVGRPVRTAAEREQKQERTRQRGVFNGTRQRLHVDGTVPGHVMYWFSDTDGRVERAQTGGWEFVTREDGVSVPGGNSGAESSDLANRFRVVMGQKENGDPMYGYLMKIKQEWYAEDQEDIHNENQRRMEALVHDGGEGANSVENRYVPKGRKQALGMASGTFNEFSKAK